MTNVKQAIQQIADKGHEIYSIVGTVKSINESERTCDVSPINGDADLLDVRLQAGLNLEVGLCIFPKQDSEVLVTFMGKNAAYVALCTEIDKVLLNTNEITFNGGENGGLVITPKLVQELNKTNTLLNSILGILSGPQIPEPGNGSPSALQIALSAAIAGKPLGDYSEIENEKIKH